MHAEHDFRVACQGAGVPDPSNPDEVLHGSYFKTLDAVTNHVWSKRDSPLAAGLYALGASSSIHSLAFYASVLFYCVPLEHQVL